MSFTESNTVEQMILDAVAMAAKAGLYGAPNKAAVQSMLRPKVVLDIALNFTLFATDKKHRRIKLICRYQQYETLDRVRSVA